MNIALLDINDSNLQLWHGDTHLQSPGYALLEGGRYLFGGAARAAARLRPREVNTRFWWQLSTEPLQPALGPARHTGDLVHAQLQELHREAGGPGEILMAISGSMQRQQLSLLLGIAQQCPFRTVGLVHRSVALGSLAGADGRLFHLEIQLHQALVSELASDGGEVRLLRGVSLPGLGLLQLQETLVEAVAAAFIRQTRFDPRRRAVTEQQLYDALPAALAALGEQAEANIEVNGYQARIARGDLTGAGQRLIGSLREITGALGPDDRLIADPLAGLLPGLAERLPEARILAGDQLRRALEQHLERLVRRGVDLHFVTALPRLQRMQPEPAAAAAPAAPQRPPAPEPTHLLEHHRARALARTGTPLGGGWELRRGGTGWELQGGDTDALVNGDVYRDGQVLRCGDCIRIGAGPELRLIEVAPQG